MKVKIFNNTEKYQAVESIESMINTWLLENSNINIKFICQSESKSMSGNGYFSEQKTYYTLTISIFYEE